MLRFFKLVLFFLFALSFVGCINTRALVEPSPAPRELVESAIVRTATPLMRDGNLVRINTIDGKPPALLDYKWVVAPGAHELEVEVQLRHPGGKKDQVFLTRAKRRLSMQVDAGREYVVDAVENAQGLWIWAYEKETGAIVAGDSPPRTRPDLAPRVR